MIDPTVSRRAFLATLSAGVVAARSGLLAAGVKSQSLGICAFSCHLAFGALRDHSAPAPFAEGPGFYDYARTIGADGAQTSVAMVSEAAAKHLREQVERTGGYYEGDLSLPHKEADLEKFERDVKLTRLAGADVARTTLSGTRRYETWKTLEAFEAFHADAPKRLALAEPIARKHRLKLAIENHKDLTSDELAAIMRGIGSEWIGVNVDFGNNLALLEDPYETIDRLAPFAFTTHLKDMAMKPHEKGFLLSEVVCGEGFLDLPRIVATLRKANPGIRFNLEMATRDPLLIPCSTDGYFATFPQRKATHLEAAMRRVRENPPTHPTPTIDGKSMPQQLADEEANNRQSLLWMHEHLRG